VGVPGVAIAALAASLLPATPAAQASAAPWTWKHVTNTVSVAATTSYTVTATCPAGFTAITGGLQVPFQSQLSPMGEYRSWDGTGWTVLFRNTSTSTGTATAVAECILATEMPPYSYDIQYFSRNANGFASGEVACPNAGEVPLTGGVDWSNGSTGKSMSASVPGWGETSWYGSGYNPVSGATLAVEVYCVSPNDVPGFEKIEMSRTGSGYFQESLTCPQGKRILNGGNLDYVNGSYPDINRWNSVFYHYNSTQTTHLRAMCVNAGSPTVTIAAASPSPAGTVTSQNYASFQLAGGDPAGYPNSFKCSLNGGATTSCGPYPYYSGLGTGQYQLVAWNTTPDGRTSGAATYSWTVDQDAPTVTTPRLPRVTLTAAATAKWQASDQGSSVKQYEAAYNLFRSDGTSTGWTKPSEWSVLTASQIKTPTLAPGETVCISVRAYDQAFNTSPWSAPGCTTRPLDDRALRSRLQRSRC
jgi:hypothetical protein